jgi:hypothetical protein
LKRAPIRNTTSAFCNARVRAAACVRSIKARTSSSALDHRNLGRSPGCSQRFGHPDDSIR